MSTPYTQLPESPEGYPNQYPPINQGHPSQYAPPNPNLNQYAPPYQTNQNQGIIYTAIPVTGTPVHVQEQKQNINSKHKLYLLGYFCVWILTIVAVGLPTWKRNNQDLGLLTQDIEIGLWKWKDHITSDSPYFNDSDTSAKVDNRCKYTVDLDTYQLLDGGACDKYQSTRAMAILKIIFGAIALVYGLHCIMRNRPEKYRRVRTFIFIGAVWGIIGINLFRSIGNGEWFDGSLGDDGWSNGHGWVLLMVASILSIILAVFYRCVIRY